MKITYYTFRFLILFFLLSACNRTEDVVIRKNSFNVNVTENVKIPLVITAKENVVFDLSVTPTGSSKIKNAVLSLNDKELQAINASSANQIDLKYTYEVLRQDVGQSLIFRLKVVDEENNEVFKDFVTYIQVAPPNVTITLPSDVPSEIFDNETAEFDIQITSENDIKYIKTFVDQSEIVSLSKETFVNPNEDIYNFIFQPAGSDADKTLPFTIEVMDVMGNLVKHTFEIKVNRSVTADFLSFFDVNLGGQRSTQHGPFLNASNGEVYVTSGAAEKSSLIDLVTFYSGSTYAYNITSPTMATVAANIYTVANYGADAIVNWPVKNQTLIKKIVLSREQFDLLASAADIENLYTGSSVTESETSGGLANNNVIVFKTSSNKYGVLFVKSRSANANTGYLTVDVKIQK